MACIVVWRIFFCFKRKTAYEVRISDWSSDVCSSDLSLFSGGFQWWTSPCVQEAEATRDSAPSRKPAGPKVGKLTSLQLGRLWQPDKARPKIFRAYNSKKRTVGPVTAGSRFEYLRWRHPSLTHLVACPNAGSIRCGSFAPSCGR